MREKEFGPKHLTSDEVSKIPEEYFRFTFVRNPYSRILSYYFWRQDPSHYWVPDSEKQLSFKDWLLLDEVPDRNRLIALSNQVEILSNRGCLQVDFVGMYENLEADWKRLSEKLKVSQSLPHHNNTNHRAYTEYYDSETLDIVTQKYEKDLAYFGYEFGDP